MLPYAVSYDDFISPDDDKRLEVFLRDKKTEGQDSIIFRKELKRIIRIALAHLPEQAQELLGGHGLERSVSLGHLARSNVAEGLLQALAFGELHLVDLIAKSNVVIETTTDLGVLE